MVPATGDDVVNKVVVWLASAGGLKDCFCSVDDRMETLFGYIRLNRPELVEGEFLRCHLFLPLTNKGIGTLLEAPPRVRHLGCYDTASRLRFGSLGTAHSFEDTKHPASGLICILPECRL